MEFVDDDDLAVRELEESRVLSSAAQAPPAEQREGQRLS